MIATGVRYAEELNTAAGLYGVRQSVLRAILDFEDADLFTLPEPAEDFARVYAASKGYETGDNDGGVTHPESNYVAMAWYLYKMRTARGDGWTPVVMYFGGGPTAEQKTIRVARIHWPEYERRWS